ncbi:hypothetical protein S83_012737 [Arachis hypogaea]
MKRKQMGMNDIFLLELIHRIFLRVPAKDLFRLRFVSKLWHSLIFDRHFCGIALQPLLCRIFSSVLLLGT